MSGGFQRSRLGEPYDGMVVRVHELCIELLGAAQRGDVGAARVVAERLVCQAGALEELLELRIKNYELRVTNYEL